MAGLCILIFFSGLDIVGAYLTSMDYINMRYDPWHLEWWGTPYQYSSMTTQLFWVFNQATSGVVVYQCLTYIQKNNRNLVYILACCMLSKYAYRLWDYWLLFSIWVLPGSQHLYRGNVPRTGAPGILKEL